MKKVIISGILFISLAFGIQAQKPEHIDESTFKQKIYDFDNYKSWKYAGNTPAIVDFYADWCGPCKRVAPILEELASEYGSKLRIYKVDTDKERHLASFYKIRSIPSFLFIPANGEPKMMVGAMAKSDFEKEINDFLKVTK